MSPARRLRRRAIEYEFCSEMSFVPRASRGLSGGGIARRSTSCSFAPVCGHCVSCWLRCYFIFVVCPFSAERWFRRRVFASPRPTSVRSTAHRASRGCCHRSFIRCDLCLSWSRAASPPLRPRRRSDVALHNETRCRWSFLVSPRSLPFLPFLICA